MGYDPKRFEAKVAEGCRRALPVGARLLVGVSGGPDSAALAGALAKLAPRLRLEIAALVHVDHQLRASSKDDAAVARRLAEALDLPFHLQRVHVEAGEGPEGGARRARYRALAELAVKLGASCVAVGHTRTDQAETVLLRLFRGAGLRGLSAMAPSRRLADGVQLVRPLLAVSRDEVRAYRASLALPCCEDPTNQDLRYRRNALRALWPQLLALSPQLERRLAELATLVRDDERTLDALAIAAYESLGGPSGRLRAEALRDLPQAVGRRVVRRLAAAANPRGQVTAAQVERVLQLLSRAAPGEAHLAGDLQATVWKGVLDIKPRGPRLRAAPSEPFSMAIPGEGRWPYPPAGIVLHVAPAPVDAADDPTVLFLGPESPFPLELRSRRPGDRFHPQGAPGSRKLKSFLIDAGIAKGRRDQLPLLCRDGEILWVVGVRAGQGAPRPEVGSTAWALRVETL
jgi:tRNA(Ile)-lysidine synthase